MISKSFNPLKQAFSEENVRNNMLKSLLPAIIALSVIGCQHTKVRYIPLSGADVKIEVEDAETRCKSEIISGKDIGNLWNTVLLGYGKSLENCMIKRGFERVEEPVRD